jgi:hypothetical protein
MASTSKVPRGCFAVRDWNGDVVIFDPRAPMTPACRVVVHLRDDFRVRLVATFVREFVDQGTVMIRVRMDQGDGDTPCLDFDPKVVGVAKVVRVDRNAPYSATTDTTSSKAARDDTSALVRRLGFR